MTHTIGKWDILNTLIKTSYTTTIFCVFFTLFGTPNGHKYIEISVIASISLGFINYIKNKKYNNINTILIISMLLYGFTLLISASIHGDLIRLSKAFFYAPLFIIFAPQLKHHDKIISISLILGTLYLFYITINQYNSGTIRPDGFTNAILFSQAILIFLLFNIYFFKSTKKYWIKSIFLISSGLSLIMLLLTQTRGVWLALIVLIFIIIIVKSTKKPTKYLLVSISLCAIGFSLYSFNPIINKKINHAISDLNKVQSEKYNTSWGLRVLAWKSALIDIKENYLIGVGLDNFQNNKKVQVERNQITPLIVKAGLYHTHNQYIQNTLIRGILGLIALMFLFIAASRLTTNNIKASYLLYAIILSYMVFSLSDVPFEHLNTAYLYLLTVSITYLYLGKFRLSTG